MAKDKKELIIDILLQAVQKETDAFNHYNKASQSSPFPETKGLLSQLAGEERKHRMILIKEIQALKGKIKRKGNAKEYIKEKDISYTLPDKLDFQKFPVLTNLDLSAISFPSKFIGGDHFDSFYLGDNFQIILSFDVAGHGLEATGVKAYAKNLVDEFKESLWEAKTGKDLFMPQTFVRMFNQKLWDLCQKKVTFLTLFYALLDTKKEKLSYISAGHEPPLFFRGGKQDLEVLETDLLIGVDKQRNYSEIKIDFGQDDILILFSDGLVESFGYYDLEFERERIVDLVKKQKPQSSEKIIKNILEDIKETLKAKPLRDDFTLSVLKLK